MRPPFRAPPHPAADSSAAVAHTPEGEEVLRGARMRAARKPSGVARELLRNFPKSGSRRRRRKRKGSGGNGQNGEGEGEGGNGAPKGSAKAKAKAKAKPKAKAKAEAKD